MITPDGTVIAQDYDGLGKVRSEAARLICDPEEVVLDVDEDGVVHERYPGRSKTVQSDKDSADINVILDRMQVQGIGPSFNPSQPRFLDISSVGDYATALRQVREAKEYFFQLDAEDRARFNNSPALFLDAVNDPVQLKALIDEGVVVDGSVVGGPAKPVVDEIAVTVDREEKLAAERHQRKAKRPPESSST